MNSINADKLASIYVSAICALGDSKGSHDQFTLYNARIIRATLDEIFPLLKHLAMYRDRSGHWTVSTGGAMTTFFTTDEAIAHTTGIVKRVGRLDP